MPIRRLSPLLVNQIAAGEVIERPASVVKELLENSLDAGATALDIQIEEGGRDLIRIADDGCGIPAEELPLALEPHATSKIAEAADLEAITTLGFRGEALASIGSISRLRLVSRPRAAESGAVIEVEGDRRSEVRPIGSAPGTVIEIRNLFFNTPARRKFMRTPATEFSHIAEAVQRIALAHPGVGFRLTHGGRVTLDLPPGESPAQRCAAVLGENLRDGLLEVYSDERGVGVWGLLGQPALARATAKHQYLYVNNRPVRDRNIAHALKEAYRGLIEPAAQPVAVLFLSIDPLAVDVNVHPAKSEVRFADAGVIHSQVLAAVRQRLLAADLTPRAELSAPPPASSAAPWNLTPAPAAPPRFNFSGSSGSGGGGGGVPSWSAPRPGPLDLDAIRQQIEPLPQTAPTANPAEAFVEYFRQMDPYQKSAVYQQVRQEMEPGSDAEDSGGRMLEPIRPAATPVLQVRNSYIVTQDEQGIVIIDQHALHERVMFQTLLDRVRSGGSLESQRLLTPAVLPASAGRLVLIENLRPLLEKIGVELEPAGPGMLAVHAFPTLLFERGVEVGPFIDDLLDRAEEERYAPTDEAALHEVLDMMSCKAAVKAGDRLQPEELGALLQQRQEIERASNCPHGRPTTIRLTLSELEKQFKRS